MKIVDNIGKNVEIEVASSLMSGYVILKKSDELCMTFEQWEEFKFKVDKMVKIIKNERNEIG